jgi:hypothetical protein
MAKTGADIKRLISRRWSSAATVSGHTAAVRALAVAFVAALALAVPATAGQGGAKLRLVQDSPLTLAGSGFRGGESVRVRLVAPTFRTKVARANAAGRFVVRFANPGCVAGLVIATARGLRSDRTASYRRLGLACPPQ